MAWRVIIWWLIKTLGPILLELILKWLLGRKDEGALWYTSLDDLMLGMREASEAEVNDKQFRAAKWIVENHADKMDLIRERIDAAKSKR